LLRKVAFADFFPRMTRPFALSLAVAALAVTAHAEVTPGEILIAEMNCAACHATPAPLTERLASRQAPKLGAEGVRATPQWLREFLADPQAAKPGTLMPDALHALPPAEKTEAVEALTHFLISLQPRETEEGRGASAAVLAEGEHLYHSLGCVMCHAPARLPSGRASDPAATAELAELAKSSIPLGDGLAKKYTLPELARFLRDPLRARPAGRMPGMNLSEGESEAVAMYLLRGQIPAGENFAAPGLRVDYYEQDFPELPVFDRLTPTCSQITSEIGLQAAKRKGEFALRFRGNVSIPADGKYTFFTESDDGSRLYIDGRQVVENGGIHPKQGRSGDIELKAGPHRFGLDYFDGGGDTTLKVSWKGPDGKKSPIPAAAFTHDTQPLRPVDDAPFTVDPAKAARGQQLFTELNCAACHTGTTSDGGTALAGRQGKPLAQLVARQPRGCLSTQPGPKVPKFELNDRQRQVILALLQEQTPLNTPLEPEQQIRRTLTTLNCYACHTRDRRGGADGLRRDFFSNIGEVDLGDEGRIPPVLTGVGAKLRPEWVKQVLHEGAKVRPYMATRMPRFNPALVDTLPAVLEKADARPDALPQPDVFAAGVAADANKFGRKMIGVGGLTCIAYNFAGNASLGVPAVDLATSAQRLKWDWFRRYLIDPQSLRPGTRMPAFWPGGVSSNKDLLGGDTEKQVFAIWAYLARKNFTDLPAGLVQGKMELIASTEAVIYRNFIEGGGSRGIGVGYPEKANVCFDANELRLALAWQGSFIDAARHRTGRGQGYEKPLGSNVIKGPAGAPFAVLASESTDWPAGVGKAAGYQFHGYRLDDHQRPAFRYTFAGVDVEDFPVAVLGETDAGLHRTLTLTAKAEPTGGRLYFRAAAGAKIEEKGGGLFLVDGKLQLRFPGSQPIVRASGGGMELLVPVVFKDGSARITEDFVW